MDLDDAYSIMANTPGSEVLPPIWARAAEAFRAGLGDRARIDLSYGAAPREVYDLFLPEQAPRGTVIFVHGGYWKAFDKSSWSHLAAGPLARGWAVAMPSYTLCPEARIAMITRQIAALVQAVADASSGPLALCGHSAGGHLVSRMVTPGVLPEEVDARIRAVVPISPLGDLRPLMRTTMNDTLRIDAAEAGAESPALLDCIRPERVCVWVGADELPALREQARGLAAAWGCDLVLDENRHHFDVIDALADPQGAMVARLTG